MQIHAPISVGELIDKITILQIKQDEFEDEVKLANVRNELRELNKLAAELNVNVVVDGTDVTTAAVTSLPVVPVLTQTISPIAKPCAAPVVMIATLFTTAWLASDPPVDVVLNTADALGVTDADVMFAAVLT